MFMKETESGKKKSIGRIIGALVIIAIIVLAVKLIKNRIEMYMYYHTYHTGGVTAACRSMRRHFIISPSGLRDGTMSRGISWRIMTTAPAGIGSIPWL